MESSCQKIIFFSKKFVNKVKKQPISDNNNIAANKMEIFKYLNKEDYAFINIDDDNIRPISKKYNTITFSLDK